MRLIPVLPFLSGIASAVAAAEAAFSAAISRQPPPSRAVIPTGGTAPAVFVPQIIVPPIQINTAETEPVQPLRFAPVKLDLAPSEPVAPPDLSEPIRKSIFEDGVSVEKAAKDNGMTEQQVLDMLGKAQGVTVTPTESNIGKQIVITDQRTGKTITIVHDYEKGTDSTTVKEANGKESSVFVDGNGVTTSTTYDPATGITKSHSVDPRTGTVTDSTTPKDGPTRIVITDAAGNKTVKIVGDDNTTTTGPDGKVTVTDNATGVTIALEKLTYAEALRLDKKLAEDIDTAETNRNAAQKKLTDAGLTPEMLANPDPSKFTAQQAKLYKEYLEAQAGLNKLLVERRILVAQFKVSLAEPGTKEHTQAINELLDEANLQKQVNDYDTAKINLAGKAIDLIAANGNASKYNLFDDALAAFRAIPANDYYFDPDGFTNGHHEYTGKLLKQEVIFKDGQIYLRNTYENHIWDGSNVLDIPLTFDPDKKRYRTDAQREIDIKWDGQSGAFTRGMCVSVDTGWNAATTQQSQAAAAYTSAQGDLARVQKTQVDATIPDLQKIYDDSVKKHGGPTTEKPTGRPDGGGEWVQIQKDGQLLWAHPEVAAAYLALRSAQEDSAALEARIRQTDKNLQWTNIQRANPGTFLDSVSPGYQDDLWSQNSDLMIRTDRNVNAAQTEHVTIRNDRVQTQIGIENANIAAWRRANPELAARLDALEQSQNGPQAGAPLFTLVSNTSSTGPTVPMAPSNWPAGTELVRPKHLENFIGPVSVDQLVPANPTLAQINTILQSKEAQPLATARQRIDELEGEQKEIKDLEGDLSVEREWLDKLEAMPEDERRDKGKRDDLHLDFVRGHAQDFSDPAQALQQQLGGPVTGRDTSVVRAMVEKMAADMKKQGMDVDVEHVVNQILRSPQINGDNPDQAGNLTINPIAMVYKESGFSVTTGVFEVTNQQGKTFVVDLKGNIWNDRDEFLNENKLYSDKGILLMPKQFDTTGGSDGVIDYEAKTARNKDFFERWLDPAIGVLTALATVASFIPVVNVVAAPIAIAGGLYLGGRAVYNQYQHVQHGGSWTDGESGMNMLSIVTAAAPMIGSGARMVGLARNGVGIGGAARFSIGAAPRSAAYFQRASYLSQASVFGGQGLASMRLARVFDSTALATGVPLVVMSTGDLANLGQMSGLDKANTILNFATGWFGSGMGYMGLRASRPGRFESVRPEDAPEVMPTDSQSGGRRWPLFTRRGDEGSGEPEASPLDGVIQVRDETGQLVNAQTRGTPPQNADMVYVPPEGDGRSPVLADGTPAWAIDPELMSKSHIFVRDPESGEAFVLPWIRGAADGPSPGPAHAPTVDQLRSMSNDDVGALSLAEIILFTDAHVGALSNRQWRALSNEQVAAIPENAIPGLSPGRLARLRPEQTAAFTDGQLAAMTKAQVRKLTLNQIDAYSPDQIRVIMDNHVEALMPKHIGRLSEHQMTGTTADHIARLSQAQIEGLTKIQLTRLTGEQMATFTPERIVWLKPEQVAMLTTDQIRGLSEAQLRALTPAQLGRVTRDQLTALSLDQVRAFTRQQIAALRPEQVAMLTPDQFSALSKDQVAGLRPEQIGRLTAEQLATFTGERIKWLTGRQLSGLRADQIAHLTPEQIAAIPVESLAGLSAAQLALFSVAQLRAFTEAQAKAFTPEQRANLTAEQAAALDAPRLKGIKRRWNGLITEIRENGKSYLLLSGVSLVNGVFMYKTGLLNPVSNLAFIVRGTGFVLQSAMPSKFGGETKWGPRFAKMYAITFIPNVADGTIKMFKPDEYAPGVYIPFGIGTIPFAAQQTHYAINGSPPTAHRGNHVGYLGYTVGSGFYIPDSYGPSAIGPWAGPASAYMFMGGSTLWLGAWIDARRAARDAPGTGRTWGEQKVDAVVLDGKTPVGKLIRGYENHRDGIDRFATGGLYGGGLILFGAMGIGQIVKDLLEDKPKQDVVDTPTNPPTTTPTQQPEDATTPEPPDEPEPPKQPEEPPFVIVQSWRPDGSPADNSTLWHVAGNNLKTLLTPQQLERVERGDFSLQDDRDMLVADWGLPRLIALNPQYPLRENPDLIQPGWRLNVG